MVDQTFDPFSDAYLQQQLNLYHEISGRNLDQSKNELTEFNLDDHVRSANSYASVSPARMVVHSVRLSKLTKYAALPDRARVLDLGCGWGLSSEFFAGLGCQVTAVDINEKFVELVRRRSLRLDLNIRAIQSSFDDLNLHEEFDLVVFYESLHHAVSPLQILQKVSNWLTPNGKIAFAGEPIQSIWWKNWGLRLDPLSLYCIRKYGWFESGWSKEFIFAALAKCGLQADYKDDQDGEIGPIVLASRECHAEHEISPKALSYSKRSLKAKIATRLHLFRRGLSLMREAASLSFLFRKLK